ncbi:MAG: hypothetical protein ACTSQX_14325 [Candidatus Heimdallarchaeota archaeon]
MVETIQDQISKAEAQLIPGDFDKAMELIENVLARKNLTAQEIVKVSVLEVRDEKSEEPVEYRKLFSFKF